MEIPHLALCGDHRMALSMTATVRSISRHASAPIHYFFVTPNYTETQKQALRNATSVERGDAVTFIDAQLRFQKLHLGRDGSDAYYYRLALPELLPDVDRILYLDSDLIVRADIVPLWKQVAQSTAPALAALDYEQTINETVLPNYADYGLTAQSHYFNSGVLGMNLATWRAEHITEQIIAFLEKHRDRCPGWDQAPINALLSARIERLDQTWNTLSFHAHAAAKIIHFVNWRKPFAVPRRLFFREHWMLAGWHAVMRGNPFYREFFEVVDETEYKHWRPRSLQMTLTRFAPITLLQCLRSFRLRRSK